MGKEDNPSYELFSPFFFSFLFQTRAPFIRIAFLRTILDLRILVIENPKKKKKKILPIYLDPRQSHPIHLSILVYLPLPYQGRPTATDPKSKASTWEPFSNRVVPASKTRKAFALRKLPTAELRCTPLVTVAYNFPSCPTDTIPRRYSSRCGSGASCCSRMTFTRGSCGGTTPEE